MNSKRASIAARCPLYACRECRTKIGWPHQPWCALTHVVEPSCADCHYWSAARGVCAHPSHKKEGDAP